MSATLKDVEPVLGADVSEGDVILGLHGSSSPITHFDEAPADSFACLYFGPGTRIAYAGPTPLTTIAPDDLLAVCRTTPYVSPADLNGGDRIILDDEVTVDAVAFDEGRWVIAHGHTVTELEAFDMVERTYNAAEGEGR